MWKAADVKNRAAKNTPLLSVCGLEYGSVIAKARAKEMVMMTVSATAVPRSRRTGSLRPLERNSRRQAALDSAPTEAPAADPTTAVAAKKTGKSSIMAVTTITAGLLGQIQSGTTHAISSSNE